MRAFFHPDQLLHEPKQFMRFGRSIGQLGLPTIVVQEGGYAISVIGACLAAFMTGFG